MTIPRPPSNVDDTAIFKRLSASLIEDPDGLKNKVNRFIAVAKPIVDSVIAGPFRHYTLHNRDHARKLIHLTEYVISRDTIETLSGFECLLIIYASYLHDMGLAVTDEEANEILASDDFAEMVRNWPQLQQSLEDKRTELANARDADRARLEVEIADIHRVALTVYLRPKHASRDRYAKLLGRIRGALPGEDPFQIRGVSFEEELTDICESHNLDAAVLGDFRSAHEDRFPRRFVVADHVANVQFVAAILRLVDILDFDFERTPRVLFESLGLKHRNFPEAEITLREWERHLSVQQLEVRDGEIVVRSQCSHPSVEAAVRQFCTTIEEEIRKTLSVVRRNDADTADRYRFRVPTNVRPEVKSRGYKYIDLALSLDESAVMSLLMGTRLYRNPYVAAREVLQNALDSCIVRQRLRPDLEPALVEMFSEKDAQGRSWLCVRDNGIGMTEHVLRHYFFRVGKSYYTSNDFARRLRVGGIDQLPLSSRFGIGFLASFMVADLVEVETRPIPAFPHMPSESGLRVTVERLGAIAYVQEDGSIADGTTVRLRLKPSLGPAEAVFVKIADFVKGNILRPAVPVAVTLPSQSMRVEVSEYYEVLEVLGTPDKLPRGRLQAVRIPLERYTKQFRGQVILFFVTTDDQMLDVKFGERLLEFGTGTAPSRIRINPPLAIPDFSGNRVAVGGFRMAFPKLSRLLRYGGTIIPAVYDIDIVPTSQASFDVARTRILDDKLTLRAELREAIKRGLADLGLWDRLPTRVRRPLEVMPEQDPFRFASEVLRKRAAIVEDEELLARIAELLPAGRWPPHIHRTIAEQLGISSNKAFDAISTLIVEGRVTHIVPTQASEDSR